MLRSNLEFWELRAKGEEEKRINTWEEEKVTLETEINEKQKKINEIQKEYSSKIEDKEKMLLNIQTEFGIKEEEHSNGWKALESELISKRDALLSDISAWEKRIKDETEAAGTKNKELEREIERLNLKEH